jgi:hypothetical protein
MGFGAYAPSGGPGGIGSTPQRSSAVLESVANILAFPFSTDVLDKSGNGQVIDAGVPTLLSQDPGTAGANPYTYDGANMFHIDDVVGEAPRITAASQAHQVPRSEPITFGCFLYFKSLVGTPQILVSSDAAGSGGNYGLQRQGSAGWRFEGASLTTLGDQRELTPIGRWFHIAMAVAGGRDTSSAGEFYINGNPVWGGTVAASDAPSSADEFGFGSHFGDTTANWVGFMCNVFVTDTLLDAATIKALSDESFGHGSPWSPSI